MNDSYNLFVIFFTYLENLVTSVNDNSLLFIDQNIDTIRYNIELLSTVSALIDSFGHSVLQNTPQIVSFIKNVLDLSTREEKQESNKKNTTQEDDNDFYTGTIDLALMLLSTILASNQVCFFLIQ